MVSSGHENSLNVMNPDRGGSGARERSKAIIPVNAIKQRPSFSGKAHKAMYISLYFVQKKGKINGKVEGNPAEAGHAQKSVFSIQVSQTSGGEQAGTVGPPLHIRAQGIIELAQTSLKWYKWSTGWGHFGSDMTLCFAHTLLNIS